MADTISKTVTITNGGSSPADIELEVPATRVKPTLTNNITSFAKPVPEGGDTQRRALNLNRIETKIQIGAVVDDAFVDSTHNGNGNRPDLSNKEEYIKVLYDLTISSDHLELKVVNDNTLAATSEFVGFIHNLDWPEKANKENSVYELTIKFVREVPMNS
jgi:hypothetical protein